MALKKWSECKNILCIRLDNMGDVLITSPAFKALKQQNLQRKITLLTSSYGLEIAKFIPEVDQIIKFDAPWIKKDKCKKVSFFRIIKEIQKHNFDGAIIFSNYSQNPMPAIMLLYLCGISHRLSYLRENPYELLTDWIPDFEPFESIRHGVTRQLDLVKIIGAETNDASLSLKITEGSTKKALSKLKEIGADLTKPWLVLHPGASEEKRRYPVAEYILAAKKIISQLKLQVILTGVKNEQEIVGQFRAEIRRNFFSLVGELKLDEFIGLISKTSLLVSNNTGPVHIASAVGVPTVVLYARTNPEHTPWMVSNKVLYFNVPENLKSKNQILKYTEPRDLVKTPTSDDILKAIKELI